MSVVELSLKTEATMGELISVTEAARRLDVSRQRIHQLIAKGWLPAQKVGNQRIIDADDLLRPEIAERAPGKRKTKKSRN